MNTFSALLDLCHRWISLTKGQEYGALIVSSVISQNKLSSRRDFRHHGAHMKHYSDVIMDTIASQITSLTIFYSTVYSDADQRKHQSSAPLAFVRGIQMASNAEMFPFDDVIMNANGNRRQSKTNHQGFVSTSNKTSYRKISCRLEPARPGCRMCISLSKFGRRRGSSATETLVKFNGDRNIRNTNLAPSRLCEISR